MGLQFANTTESWQFIEQVEPSLLMGIVTVVTTQQGVSLRPWTVGGEPTMGRDNGRISQKWAHPLSFPQDQTLGNRRSPEPQQEFPTERKDLKLKHGAIGRDGIFHAEYLNLVGSFCMLLAKIQATLGILFGFYLFNLLLTECNFREELLWLWWMMAAHSAYSINIYRAFIMPSTMLGAEAKIDEQSTVPNSQFGGFGGSQEAYDPVTMVSGHKVPSTSPSTAHFMTPCFVSLLYPF